MLKFRTNEKISRCNDNLQKKELLPYDNNKNSMKNSSKSILFALTILVMGGFFMSATHASAATYYVANGGNDACDGTSSTIGSSGSCAWKTIAKVNSVNFAPGDSILFNKGDTWNEALTASSSGAVGNPITYGSYGAGANPVITGLFTLGNNWVDMGSNVWRYDVSALPAAKIRYLLLNGTNQKMTQSAVRYTTNSTTSSLTDATLGGADGDYVGSEVVMRSTSYTWDIRSITSYTASSGLAVFSPSNSYALGKNGDSTGGYMFQNSLKVLQQNATQNEWANQGTYLYYYSTTNPYTLGTIQVSSLDKLMNLGAANYITVSGFSFSYANQYCIWGNGGNNKTISNNTFTRCVTGIFENNQITSNTVIDSNTFTDIGSIAIYQYYATNITVTNNNITNVGLEIGRAPYLGNFGMDNMWYVGVVVYPSGGLFEYNNIRNTGYSGFMLTDPTNQALAQHNYVENPCVLLTDGGAFYSYGSTDTTASNINKITYRNNIAVETNTSTSTSWLIGYQGNTYGWLIYGFYKDGFLRATNWDNNFAYGFKAEFYSNPTKYSSWTNNVGVATYSGLRALQLTDISASSQYLTNSQFTGNTFVNTFDNSDIIFLYDAQATSSSGNTFDYNKLLRPSLSWRGSMVMRYPAFTHFTFTDWEGLASVVGIHEQTDNFFLAQSGLASSTDMVWLATNPTKNTVSVNFPAGYRYYTTDGVPVPSDTLTAYQGKIYYRTIDQAMPQANNTAVSGGYYIGAAQTGTYTYSNDQGNAQATSTYQWYRSSDGTTSAKVAISGATGLTYTTTSTDQGQYIIFGVVPKSTTGTSTLLTGIERLSSPKLISNAGKAILNFNFAALSPAVTGTVNESAKTVTLTVPYDTDLSALAPTIGVTGTTVSPASGVSHSFTDGVPSTYTVTAGDTTTQAYAVTVNWNHPPHTVGTDKVNIAGGARIYSDGKFMDLNTTSTSYADLTITPQSGSYPTLPATTTRSSLLDITNITWLNSGTYHKAWSESSASSTLTNTVHTIGDLEPNKFYEVSIDGVLGQNMTGPNCAGGICQANAQGKITFTYTSHYSTHTFDVTSAPVLAVAPATLSVSADFGSTTSTQSLVIANNGASNTTLNWTATTTETWLTLANATGALAGGTTTTLSLLVNPVSLPRGNYIATTTISDPNASSSPQTVAVSLVISSTSGSSSGSVTTYYSAPSGGGGGSTTPVAVATTTVATSTSVVATTTTSVIPTSESDIKALIATLTAQLNALLAQARQQGITLPASFSTSFAPFTRDLWMYDTGLDVKELQQFLNTKGFIVSAIGPGSFGNEVQHFGLKTFLALKKFQASVGITPASGYFGPKTRAYVNAHL